MFKLILSSCCIALAVLTITTTQVNAASSEVLITVNADIPTTQSMRPVWTRTNIWDIARVPDERATTMVREIILMTATGGRPSNNMVRLNEHGTLECDFTSLTLALDKTLKLNLKPNIVLGNVPDCLSSETELRVFEVNTRPPNNYPLYQKYITQLFTALVKKYGMKNVLSWEYRLMTEPDNESWWYLKDRAEYRRLYDATVAAARDAAPKIIIDGGNYMDLYPHPNSWEQWWPEWIASNEPTEFPGALPRHINEISFSCYGGMFAVSGLAGQLGADPRALITIMDNLRKHSAVLGYPVKFTIAEGQMLFDENHRYLWLGDGTELGAAWNAAMVKLAHDTGLDRNVQWGTAGLADGKLKSPVFHTLMMYERMLEQRIMQSTVTTSDTLPASAYVDSMVTRAKDGTVNILVFHFNYDRQSTHTVNVELDLNAKANYIIAHHTLIDRDHSNFMTQWIKDSVNLKLVDRGQNSGSCYDLDIQHVLDDEGLALWKTKRDEYIANKRDKIQSGKHTMDDAKTIRFTLQPNSVTQFVLKPKK